MGTVRGRCETLASQPLLAALMLVMFGQASARAAADWRTLVPEGWLVSAVVEAPRRSLETATDLFGESGDGGNQRLPLLRAAAAVPLPAGVATDRPIVGLLVATHRAGDTGNGFEPMLLLPTNAPARLLSALRAERAEDLWIASLAGLEVAIREAGGWLVVTPLDGQLTGDPPPASPSPPQTIAGASVQIALSPRGAEALSRWLATAEPAAAAAPAGRPVEFAGRGVRRALRRWSHVVDAVAAWRRQLVIGVRSDATTYQLSAWVERIDSIDETPRVSPRGFSKPSPDERAIAWFAWRSGLPRELLDVGLAYARCQANAVEARVFPSAAWDAFAEAMSRLASSAPSGTLGASDPQDKQPLATNLAARLDAGDARFVDRVVAVAGRWNDLLAASKARTRARLETGDPPGDGPGVRLTCDLIDAFGVKPVPEVLEVLDRFYGPDGKARLDVTPFDNAGVRQSEEVTQSWRVGFAGAASPEWIDSSAASDDLARGELHVSRWLAWAERTRRAATGRPDSVDRNQPKNGLRVAERGSTAELPLTLRVRESIRDGSIARGLTVEAIAPRAAVNAWLEAAR